MSYKDADYKYPDSLRRYRRRHQIDLIITENYIRENHMLGSFSAPIGYISSRITKKSIVIPNNCSKIIPANMNIIKRLDAMDFQSSINKISLSLIEELQRKQELKLKGDVVKDNNTDSKKIDEVVGMIHPVIHEEYYKSEDINRVNNEPHNESIRLSNILISIIDENKHDVGDLTNQAVVRICGEIGKLFGINIRQSMMVEHYNLKKNAPTLHRIQRLTEKETLVDGLDIKKYNDLINLLKINISDLTCPKCGRNSLNYADMNDIIYLGPYQKEYNNKIKGVDNNEEDINSEIYIIKCSNECDYTKPSFHTMQLRFNGDYHNILVKSKLSDIDDKIIQSIRKHALDQQQAALDNYFIDYSYED